MREAGQQGKWVQMIGVVGPDDTVELIKRVARESGLGQVLVTATYTVPEETPRLVGALLRVCPVILFSGRLPYRLALAAGFPQDRLDFIQHEGTDLFRTLALVALGSDRIGHIPRFSFDCIPASDIDEAFDELDLTDNYRVIPLERGEDGRDIDLGRIVEEHRSLLRDGTVEQCATCIRSVYETLSAERLPVIRINHSRASVRQALLRAKLRHDLVQAEATQTAVCLLSPRSGPAGAIGDMVSQAARQVAAILDGHVLREDESGNLLISTRSAVESRLKPQPLDTLGGHDLPLVLGVGFGSSAEQAETLARQAQQHALLIPEQFVQLDDVGRALFATMDPDDAREGRQTDLDISQTLQISPAVIRRLTAVFRVIDPNGFTAAELAQSYKFLPRSARRLLKLLKDRGFVEECGLRNRSRAGRPEVVYRIFLDRILLPNT